MGHAILTAFEAWLEIAISDARVRFSPFGSIRRLSIVPDDSMALDVPQMDLAVFRAIAARHIVHPTCLTKAIALVRFLRRRRVAAVLCMGLGRDKTEVGHAWVEVGSRVVAESESVTDVYGRLAVSHESFLRSDGSDVILAPHIASQVIAGEAVLVNLLTGQSIGLNETASFVWTRLASTRLEHIADQLVDRFGMSRQEAYDDLKVLIGELERRGFLRQECGMPPPA